jgi:ribonucleoside-diphosphate reductase alpha chain
MPIAEAEIWTSENHVAAVMPAMSFSPAKNENTGAQPARAVRRRLPDERRAITHHFSIAGESGYLTVGIYEDGSPGEILVRMAKEGSAISGLMDSFGMAASLALQYGAPLSLLCDKFRHMRFEPSGWTGNPEIGYAKSLMDYIARWLELKFLKAQHAPFFEDGPKLAKAS